LIIGYNNGYINIGYVGTTSSLLTEYKLHNTDILKVLCIWDKDYNQLNENTIETYKTRFLSYDKIGDIKESIFMDVYVLQINSYIDSSIQIYCYNQSENNICVTNK